MYKSKWEGYYRDYKSLEQSWNNAHDEITKQTFRQVLTSPKDPISIRKEMEKLGYGLPNDDQWETALKLRDVILDMPTGWSVDDPLEDVYQTALRMETFFPTWNYNVDKSKIFRGQRDSNWKVMPKLFRSTPNSKITDSKIESSIEKIGGFVRGLQANGHDITDEEGVAIVQHYSAILKIGTWLIDFTWNPFVALFFASDSDRVQDGDVGVISYLGLGEFKRFSASGKNRLGAIRYIEPQGVPRISAQDALFLDTSHPDLYDQFVPHSLYFKQRSGLHFEDPLRTPAVTRSAIYPENDPFIEEMKNLKPVKNAKSLTFKSASDASHRLSYTDYENIVSSWIKSEQFSFTSQKTEIAKQVCKVYTKLQRHRDKIAVTSRSLHRLKHALDYINKFDNPTLMDVARFWGGSTRDRGHEVVVRLFQEVERQKR